MTSVSAPPQMSPAPLPSNDVGGSSAQSSSTPPGQPSTGGSRDTKVFGNLEGRDPDLLFAGEKIMINGKEVTVADGDTLSSLAAKHGTTVEKLISENKMDASLNGKNGPNGAWFTPGGPQPANGGSTTPPPNATAPNNTTKPSTPDSGEQQVIELKLAGNAEWKAAGLLGGLMNPRRAEGMLNDILAEEKKGNTYGFTPDELNDLKSGLVAAKQGTPLSAEQKTLVNQYMAREGLTK
jgi:LysM domain